MVLVFVHWNGDIGHLANIKLIRI